MAKKVILKDNNNHELMPITRGELILDSSGNKALHSNEFLANTSLPGLMSSTDKIKIDGIGNIISFTPSSISLNNDWKPTGFILNNNNGFVNGVYLIKISVGNLLFSGISSIYVGKITTSDEIILHMCGIPQTYIDGIQGRIYAKIAPSNSANYGEIFLATNIPQSEITNLSITMKKMI